MLVWGCESQTSKDYGSREVEKSVDDVQSTLIYKKENSNVGKRAPGFSILSWNIQDLGRTKSKEEIIEICQILRHFDLVLIQEIVGKDPAGIQAVGKIVDYLNRMGFKWDYRVSDPTNSPSFNKSERYGFLWKTSKVDLKGRAWLDYELSSICDREPYIGKFQFKDHDEEIFIINFHSRVHSSHPEEEIFFLQNYDTRFGSNNIILGGDFNINERHPVWRDFYKKGFKNALSDTPTTLRRKCKSGNYLNHSIDNFYYSLPFEIVESGIVDFVKGCENLENVRGISDHLPVYFIFK